jgi:hypothetical protein
VCGRTWKRHASPNSNDRVAGIKREFIPCQSDRKGRGSNNPDLNNRNFMPIKTTKIPEEMSEQTGSPRARYHRVSGKADCKRCKGAGQVKVSFWSGRDYWFEQQFEEHTYVDRRASGMERQARQYRDKIKGKYDENKNYGGGGTSFLGHSGYLKANGESLFNPQGRNPRTVWKIPTQPYKEAHFATFPEKLVDPMIKSGCPEFVCNKCGMGREKIYDRGKLIPIRKDAHILKNSEYPDSGKEMGGAYSSGRMHPGYAFENKPIGYTSCSCNASFSGGIVLDPFMGSGTVAVVAENLGRQWIGIEINKRYIEMANKRILKNRKKLQGRLL